jgi:hypothetical protein
MSSKGISAMNDTDKPAFTQILAGTLECYGRAVTPAAIGTWWAALAGHALGDVRLAFTRYVQDPDQGRYPPTPAGILAQMTGAELWIGADEAWALCLESFDEAVTVCVTDVILEARAAAQLVWQSGDKIGARVAFRAAYERIVQARRMEGRAARWQLSAGWDAERREQAALAAVSAGRLSREAVARFLPAPEMTPEGRAIAGLLTGDAAALPEGTNATVRWRIAELRASLEGGRDARPIPAERERFEAARMQALADVERLAVRRAEVGAEARGHGGA